MAKQTFTTGQVLTAAQMTSLQQTAMGGGSTTAKTTSYVLVAADAGTVVAMNAAGATTITVNTGLFSAGDTVFIQNWGAGTCTVTAGTATVTTHGSLALSQWEGGTLYFTSASAAIFFDISQTSGMTNPMTTTGDMIYSSSGSTPARLGLGTAGQVLKVNSGATAPEWGAASGGFSGCSVSNSTDQTLSNATYTTLTFNTEVYDTDGYHSTTSNTGRFTVPSGKAGYYEIYANCVFGKTSATGDRDFRLMKNGTALIYAGEVPGSTTAVPTLSLKYTANLAVGDYIEIQASQESGGNLTVFTSAYPAFFFTYLGA